MSEHTKTPWAVGYSDGISGDVASWGCYLDEVECHEVVIRSGQEAVAIIYYGDPDSNAEANARHIVHCVNNHERLVEALWHAMQCWEYDGVSDEHGAVAKHCSDLLAALEAEKGGD